jgi:hypothetical protein
VLGCHGALYRAINGTRCRLRGECPLDPAEHVDGKAKAEQDYAADDGNGARRDDSWIVGAAADRQTRTKKSDARDTYRGAQA